MWRQSKTGMWHLIDGQTKGKDLAKCQSYNLDRPNYLVGKTADKPPTTAKVCKKCSSKAS